MPEHQRPNGKPMHNTLRKALPRCGWCDCAMLPWDAVVISEWNPEADVPDHYTEPPSDDVVGIWCSQQCLAAWCSDNPLPDDDAEIFYDDWADDPNFDDSVDDEDEEERQERPWDDIINPQEDLDDEWGLNLWDPE